MAHYLSVEGVYTAMVTPFTDQLEIDETSWYRLLDEQAAAKINGVIISGTTGESPTLNASEFDFLLQTAREHLSDDIQVWAGTGTNATDISIQRSKRAEELGADGILLVTPYYNKPTQSGLKKHFLSIVEATDLPAMLYNVPGRTGTLIEPETTEELCRHPNIIASKEATGDMNQIMEVISRVSDQNSVLSGDDALTLPTIAAGGAGVVSVISNIVPGLMRALVSDARAGNMESAREIHTKLWPLMKASFLESNPIPIKTALGMTGKIHPYMRPPLSSMSDFYHGELTRTLTDLNLLD